jgi:segregation and condensation protein A
MLSSLADNRSHNFHRQSKQIINSDEGEVIENLFQDTSLFDIARIFKNAMENRPVISQFELQSEPIKLEEQKKFIFRYFDGDGRVKFSTLLSKLHSRIEIVVTFLAILDLVREGVCTFSQSELFGDLELYHMGVEA